MSAEKFRFEIHLTAVAMRIFFFIKIFNITHAIFSDEADYDVEKKSKGMKVSFKRWLSQFSLNSKQLCFLMCFAQKAQASEAVSEKKSSSFPLIFSIIVAFSHNDEWQLLNAERHIYMSKGWQSCLAFLIVAFSFLFILMR